MEENGTRNYQLTGSSFLMNCCFSIVKRQETKLACIIYIRYCCNVFFYGIYVEIYMILFFLMLRIYIIYYV